MPNAVIERATCGHAITFADNDCASFECAIKVGVPGEINHLVFEDNVFVNEGTLHDAALVESAKRMAGSYRKSPRPTKASRGRFAVKAP